MNEPFDPAALVDALAPLLGFDIAPESRGPVILHLKIAADLAARLETVELDDEAEPAAVFTA